MRDLIALASWGLARGMHLLLLYRLQVLPEAPVELVVELSRRYIMLYERITGQQFQPAPLDQSPARRMASNIAAALEKL